MNKDLISNIGVRVSLFPNVYSGVCNGQGIDTFGFNSCVAIFSIGDLGGGTAHFSIEDSSDGTYNWHAVPSSRFIGSFNPTVQTGTTHCVGLIDVGGVTKRFIRLVITITGGLGARASAFVILGHPLLPPVSNPSDRPEMLPINGGNVPL